MALRLLPGAGLVMVAPLLVTVSVAALLVAEPAELVKTARYWKPLNEDDAVNDSVALVAPLMSLKLVPPSLLTCHCTAGAGVPLAAAVNVAVWPAVTVWFAGCAVIEGA